MLVRVAGREKYSRSYGRRQCNLEVKAAASAADRTCVNISATHTRRLPRHGSGKGKVTHSIEIQIVHADCGRYYTLYHQI
ncbi:hypothetical protein CEXT_714891 [Caerostris extrusa]|uniref:Uncharacterized protein n=1 Tax=Caerostris extrusa TaxID=172846 RepID=A0AAV4XPI5_CAEEX|nr:hypothetical protein CEXT_714891 [Caerostris extrusa]